MHDKRIDFLGRWALAFFVVFVALVGWIGNSIRTEQFDIIFQIGVNLAVLAAIACGVLTRVTLQLIKRREESKNVRN